MTLAAEKLSMVSKHGKFVTVGGDFGGSQDFKPGAGGCLIELAIVRLTLSGDTGIGAVIPVGRAGARITRRCGLSSSVIEFEYEY